MFNSALPFEAPVCLEREESSVFLCVLGFESLQWRYFVWFLKIPAYSVPGDSLEMAL